MKYKYHCRNCGCDFNEFKQVDYGTGLGDYVNCCPDCFSENYEKNSISMTEQEYMKLVMLHKEKQKEAEDEAYLLRKENESLRKQVEFNRKYGIHSNAMKEIERLRKDLEYIAGVPHDWSESYDQAYKTCVKVAAKALEGGTE